MTQKLGLKCNTSVDPVAADGPAGRVSWSANPQKTLARQSAASRECTPQRNPALKSVLAQISQHRIPQDRQIIQRGGEVKSCYVLMFCLCVLSMFTRILRHDEGKDWRVMEESPAGSDAKPVAVVLRTGSPRRMSGRPAKQIGCLSCTK